MFKILALLVSLGHIFSVDGLPLITGTSKAKAFYYLVNYGYITKNENKDTAQLLSEEVVTAAIKEFQVFAGLDPSGELTDETVELMNTPRCGVKDQVGPGTQARRKKRYALQGSRWRVKTLTWRISRYPSSGRLSKSKLDDEIKQAFQLWADKTALTFERKDSGSVHIDIRFEKREHGDGDPFDGPGGTLAHAFFPQYGGDAHFDDQEYWTINEFKGTNLLQTAAHEFGHSLGLSHSDVRSALMAPFYKGWEPNLRLHSDDIDAIQALYGQEDSSKDSTTTTTTRRPQPDDSGSDDDDNTGGDGGNSDNLCSDPNIDTLFSTDDGNFYVFKGSQYWKLTEDSVAHGYPRAISDDWPGLPNNIDAAVTWPDNGMTYFFKGRDYWKFDNQQPQDDYPKRISDGFEGIPSNVDAAFVWGGNGKIYFFKGSQYWKFDPTRKPPVRSVYPRDISNWDLPPNIQAAVRWTNKHTYFFHDAGYYRFNDRRFTIDSGDPAFPRPAGPWWYGCNKDDLQANDEDEDEDTDISFSDGGVVFTFKGLKRDEASFALNFDEEGDELLDVIPADQ